MLLVRLLSAFMGDERDRVCSLKGLRTCSPHLPCRAGEHLLPLMKAGNRRKKGLQPLCSPGRPLSLGNFPKGLHSSGILAESYPELKALSSIACQGSGSWSSAPVTTLVFVNVIFVCMCAGLGGIASCAGLELR